MDMVKIILTPEQALRALARGKVLENEDGLEILLDGSTIFVKFTMGKNNMLIKQKYCGDFAGLFFFKDMSKEEQDASE